MGKYAVDRLEISEMLNEERQRAILDLLRRDGRVLVVDLAKQFHTSQVTIRKDLEILHVRGQIHRTHGGALPARHGALEDPSLREKEKLHRKEKLQIASAAARMVSEGQVVVLDSGTTTTAIARALRNFQNLTVITNAANIAAELSGSVLFNLQGGRWIRLAPGRMILGGSQESEEFSADELAELSLLQGTVTIRLRGAKTGWLGTSGGYLFPFNQLANARLFFHLVEKVVGIPIG